MGRHSMIIGVVDKFTKTVYIFFIFRSAGGNFSCRRSIELFFVNLHLTSQRREYQKVHGKGGGIYWKKLLEKLKK